jgi:hypothetical protein
MHNMPPMNRSNPTRFRPHTSYSPSNMNQSETQAQLVAFTPPLMSLRVPYPGSQIHQRNYHSSRPYMHNQSNDRSFLSTKNKSKTAVSQPEYYVDSFAPNFSTKPSSDSNNKPKTKHVTFQEPDTTKSVFVQVFKSKFFYNFI